MTDLERVLQGLDCVSGFGHCLQSEAFAGGICAYCIKEIAKKAKELLKEQEAVEPSFNERMKHFVCRNCSLVLDEGRDNYCPSCGKRIAWVEYYIHEDETEGRCSGNDS